MAKITYADKTYVNQNVSVPANNKVQDADMNEIKSVVNTNDDNVGDITTLATNTKSSTVGAINELKNAEIYSTSEVKTNKVWIDGKPIYRKVFNLSNYGTIQNGSTITASISNISEVIHQEYIYKYSNRYISFPLVESTGNTLHASYDASNQKIQMNGAGSWTARPMTATIEYTKTS